MVGQHSGPRLLIALVALFSVVFVSCDSGGAGSSAEQKRHEVCGGLLANKAKPATLVDEAQAAALQDAKLTTFAQALTAWAKPDGSMTVEQNHTITTTCHSEFKAAAPSS